MTLTELAAVSIALLSLAVSLWVVIRDRRQRQVDVLYQCYERLRQAQDSEPFATVSQHAEMDEKPDDPSWEEYHQKSRDAQMKIDQELEFACFMVIQKQIDLLVFFCLFKGWLASRASFWKQENNHWKARNHPYTVNVLELCRIRGLIPIKDNKELQKLQATVDNFLSRKLPSNKSPNQTGANNAPPG